jgi:YVTN family beta-propeller protein
MWALTRGSLAKYLAAEGGEVTLNPPHPIIGRSDANSADSLVYDGVNVWAVLTAESAAFRLSTSNGAILERVSLRNDCLAAAFDGTKLWFACGNELSTLMVSSSQKDHLSFKGQLSGVAFDGESVWVTNHDSQSVTKVRAADRAILGTYPVGREPTGVAFDGTHVWVVNSRDNTVSQLLQSDGSVVATYAVGPAPLGIAFDGASIWVVNSGDGTLSKL